MSYDQVPTWFEGLAARALHRHERVLNHNSCAFYHKMAHMIQVHPPLPSPLKDAKISEGDLMCFLAS